jgi:hypothetical protein
MIPLHTTTVSVLRRADPADAYEDDNPASWQPIAAGVRAHLDAGSGSSTFAGGERSDSLCRFMTDPTDVTSLDVILDEITGLRWQVTAVQHRLPAEGILEHMSGQAQRWEGVAG